METNSKTRSFFHTAMPYVYLIAALLAVRSSIVEPYVVPTGSMEPTLKTGDRLYALKCAYDVRVPILEWIFPTDGWTLFRTSAVKRGDVILFIAPHNPSVTYVKRAIGLPGDKLEFRQGALFVNGKQMVKGEHPREPVMYDIERKFDKTLFIENLDGVKHYVILDSVYQPHRDFPEITVPPEHLFAVGDNRDNSLDSRSWGFVPMKNLKGRAMFIWFSSWEWRIRPERLGTLIQ